MTHSPSHEHIEGFGNVRESCTERLVELLQHIRSRGLRMVLLLEWLMPQQGRLVPMKKDGKPIIARIPFTVEMLHELISGRDIVEKMWAMNHRFGYHSISLPPAKVRVRLDYLVEGDTKLPVNDRGVVCDANGMANGHTIPVIRVIEHLFETLGGICNIPIKPSAYEVIVALNKLNLPSSPETLLEEERIGRIYEGSQSKWLSDQFESLFNPLRVCADPTEQVIFILDFLWRMLSQIKRPNSLSIKDALRPMILPQKLKLEPVPRFPQIKEPIQDAMFSWTTESIPQQVEGHVSIAPQTRFGWCTDRFVVVVDFRLDRTNPQLELLPSCNIVAIDLLRELGYLISCRQLDDMIGVHAALRIVEIRCPHPILALMTLTNIRFALPHQFDPEIEDNGLVRTVDTETPYWMAGKHVYRYELLNMSGIHHMTFQFRLLPEQFDDILKEMMWMFHSAAIRGFRMRVRFDTSDTHGTLLQISHPAQAGTACINELVGGALRGVSWAWIKWMVTAFQRRTTTPWHVLAWRFIECACRAGLTDLFARHLWRLDKTTAAVMFGQRTLLAHRDGAVIPLIRYPYSLEKGYSSDAVMNVPARMLGRRLAMTPEQYRKHIVEFNPAEFEVMFRASMSMLELIMGDE